MVGKNLLGKFGELGGKMMQCWFRSIFYVLDIHFFDEQGSYQLDLMVNFWDFLVVPPSSILWNNPYLERTTRWVHQSFPIRIRFFGMMPPTVINGSVGCLVLWTKIKICYAMQKLVFVLFDYLLLFVLRYNTESSAAKCRWFLSKISCAYWHSDGLTTGGAIAGTAELEGLFKGGFFMMDFLAIGWLGPGILDDVPPPVKTISS